MSVRIRAWVAAALSGSILLHDPARAQTVSADQPTASKGSLETVTVLGEKDKKDPVPVKATFTESSIDEEMLRNLTRGADTTIQTLLNVEPSIYATTAAPNGMRTDIHFRAFVDGQFGETIDGIPLNDMFNAGVTNQAENRNNILLEPDDIQGVDIYRGINNPAVNTYNSLGGTINYRPRQPSEAAGLDAGFDYGSFHTLGWHVHGDTGDFGGLKQTLSVSHTTSNGWLQNTQDWNTNVYWSAKFDTQTGSQLYTYLFYNHNRGHSPNEVPVPLIDQSGDSFQFPLDWYAVTNDDTNYLAALGWRTQLNDSVRFDSKFYGGDNDYRRTSYSNPLDQQGNTVNGQVQPWLLQDSPSTFDFWDSNPASPTYTSPNNTVNNGITLFGSLPNATQYHFYGYDGTEFGYLVALTADLPYDLVTVGGNVSYGMLHSREYWYGTYNMPMISGYNDAWDEQDTRLLLSAYLQDDIHFWNDRAHITPGVKFLQARTTDSDAVGFYYGLGGNDAATQRFISPTIGANFEVLPGLAVYAAFGRNTKFPDINAFYGGFQQRTNPDGTTTWVIVPVNVKPEYVNDYEAGVRYKAEGFVGAVDVYQENFENTFVTVTNQQTFLTSYFNAGASRYRGVELQLSDNIASFAGGSLSAYLNASLNQALYTATANIGDTGASVTDGEHVTNVPTKLLSTGLVWRWQDWRFTVDGQFAGLQYLDEGFAGTPVPTNAIVPGQPTHIPSYFLLGAGVVRVIPLDTGFAKAVKLSINGQNLLDRRYFTQATTYQDINYSSATNSPYDVYGLMGAPRAVYGSVSVYF